MLCRLEEIHFSYVISSSWKNESDWFLFCTLFLVHLFKHQRTAAEAQEHFVFYYRIFCYHVVCHVRTIVYVYVPYFILINVELKLKWSLYRNHILNVLFHQKWATKNIENAGIIWGNTVYPYLIHSVYDCFKKFIIVALYIWIMDEAIK